MPALRNRHHNTAAVDVPQQADQIPVEEGGDNARTKEIYMLCGVLIVVMAFQVYQSQMMDFIIDLVDVAAAREAAGK